MRWIVLGVTLFASSLAHAGCQEFLAEIKPYQLAYSRAETILQQQVALTAIQIIQKQYPGEACKFRLDAYDEQVLQERAAAAAKLEKDTREERKKEPTKTSRTFEEVSLVFDKNKGAIYSLYSRALRENPTLQGKVVLEITIDPTGRVAECQIVSSELNSPELEGKLIERVKLLNFGARDAEIMVVRYPINFLHS